MKRNLGSAIASGLVLLALLAVLGFWLFFGFYRLEPGQAAVLLRFGKYLRTEGTPGLRFHWPAPIESHDIVSISSIEREEFGFAGGVRKDAPPQVLHEATMQTSDNNIVHLGFVVQYRIKDAFFARYRVAQLHEILRDAAQAAVREIVGRTDIDGVLSDKRGQVEVESEELLQSILDRYDAGLSVLAIQLQEVQPPLEVREAFDDVIGAAQDRSRSVNEAEGYANEVMPKARGEASEQRERAQGYRDAVIASSQGQTSRFSALAQEYAKAPEVTRKRLYLEAMEEVLPKVEKVVVEHGAAPLLPYLPLPRSQEPAR